ncbi:hypothetical protein M5W98_30200 [Paenibacillus apiarius]|nr:hypothetical protein [Paenibacillus apiarius]
MGGARLAELGAYGITFRDDDLVIAVCDNAHEELTGPVRPRLHWSVPDPVRIDTDEAFEAAYADLADRVDRLAPTTMLRGTR